MRSTLATIIIIALAVATSFAQPAGAQPSTTILTHGFSPDSKGPWVQGMAEAILARAGEGSIYRYTGEGPPFAKDREWGAPGAWTFVPSAFSDGTSDVLVLIFNWVPESDGPAAGPNWNYAQAAGDALYAMLRSPRFSAAPDPQNLPGDLVMNRIVQFIGHSRGACVNSEAVQRLALAGIPVDQFTTHDPHPVNGTLDAPYNFNWNDPVPTVWSNVTWADNYWRADGGGLINGLDFDGISISNAFNTLLNESALNCCAYSFAHSDVHLWYHGTIDLAPNPCDGEQCITNQMRQTWWPEGYTQRGFFYSHLGGGSAQRPGPINAGVDPAAAPLLYGGDFAQASYAGWLHHGGSVLGTITTESGNGYLRLGPAAASSAAHNRFFLPPHAAAIEFDYRIITAAPDESLHVALNLIGGGEGPQFILGEVPLNFAGGWIIGHSLPIPSAAPRAELYTLTFKIVDAAGGAIAAVAGVDNIDIVVQPPIPGDVTGDGCVNVLDLLAVINAWGACPDPQDCPADINTDGAVDVSDLLIVINAWSPCG